MVLKMDLIRSSSGGTFFLPNRCSCLAAHNDHIPSKKYFLISVRNVTLAPDTVVAEESCYCGIPALSGGIGA